MSVSYCCVTNLPETTATTQAQERVSEAGDEVSGDGPSSMMDSGSSGSHEQWGFAVTLSGFRFSLELGLVTGTWGRRLTAGIPGALT